MLTEFILSFIGPPHGPTSSSTRSAISGRSSLNFSWNHIVLASEVDIWRQVAEFIRFRERGLSSPWEAGPRTLISQKVMHRSSAFQFGGFRP
jgi:hypothetical protein